MDSSAKKRRYSPRKSPKSKVPDHVATQCSRFEHFFNLPLAQQWLSYEWQYNDIEDAYFNHYNTFESNLAIKFPKLRTRNLIKAEWRTIRRLLGRPRRFSPTFIHDQRIEVEKYRRRYQTLQKNQQLDQLVKLNTPIKESSDAGGVQSQFELYYLIVKTTKLLTAKKEMVAELRLIYNAVRDANETNANAINAIKKLRELNEEIISNLEKMLSFQTVKDALLYAALDKNKMTLALSPVHFGRNCQVRINENHHGNQSEKFITFKCVMILINVLLEEVNMLFEHNEYLAADPVEYLKSLVTDHQNILKPMITAHNFDLFETKCLPMLHHIMNIMYSP